MKIPAIRRSLRLGLLALPVAALVSTGVAVNASASETAHSHDVTTQTVSQDISAKGQSGDISAAREATARFNDINVAKASGYPEDLTGCVESPAGGMGHHYVNLTLEGDGGQLDVTKPEALLYEPQEDGSLDLVALEYVVRAADVPSTGPAPVLFGRAFEFNAVANAWTLHAWVWRSNPNGMFTPFNPNVSCEFAS
jgi:hypothetical protein